MDKFNEETLFNVVIPKVLSDNTKLTVTRLLAASLTAEPYMTVRDFLIGISDKDLETLIDVAEDEESKNFGDLILIGEMLAQAEGLDAGNLEVCQKRLSQLVSFLAVESLFRKGLIKIHRQNMSFGEDYGNKIIAERLE